jgi:hypothetical protein
VIARWLALFPLAVGCLLPDYRASSESGGAGASGGGGAGGEAGSGGGGAAPVCPVDFALGLGTDSGGGTFLEHGFVSPASGQTFVAGRFYEDLTLGPDVSATHTDDTSLLVASFAADGAALWARSFHGGDKIRLTRLIPVSDGAVALVVSDGQPVTISGDAPQPTGVVGVDSLAIKIRSDGTIPWVRQITGNGYSQLEAVTERDGELWLGGWGGGENLIEDTPIPNGGDSPFVVRLDAATGDLVEVHAWRSIDARLRDMLLVGDDLFVLGSYSNVFPFGVVNQPGPADNQRDVFLARLNPSFEPVAGFAYGAANRLDDAARLSAYDGDLILFGTSDRATDDFTLPFEVDPVTAAAMGQFSASFVARVSVAGEGQWAQIFHFDTENNGEVRLATTSTQGGAVVLGHVHVGASRGDVAQTGVDDSFIGFPAVDTLLVELDPVSGEALATAQFGVDEPGPNFPRLVLSRSVCGDLVVGAYRGELSWNGEAFEGALFRGFVAHSAAPLPFEPL